MDTPIIIVNCKTYEQATGDNALALAKTCETVAEQRDAAIAIAVQNADLHRISAAVNIPVLAQHVDAVGYGSNTGKDMAETLAYNGADGVLINHSEDQTPLETIEEATERAQDAGLETVICVDVPEMAEEVSAFGPAAIAYEPSELIGGDISVATASPELIEAAVDHASCTVLCGAGIKDADDVRVALERGSKGILVASGVIKADDPAAALGGLVDGLR